MGSGPSREEQQMQVAIRNQEMAQITSQHQHDNLVSAVNNGFWKMESGISNAVAVGSMNVQHALGEKIDHGIRDVARVVENEGRNMVARFEQKIDNGNRDMTLAIGRKIEEENDTTRSYFLNAIESGSKDMSNRFRRDLIATNNDMKYTMVNSAMALFNQIYNLRIVAIVMIVLVGSMIGYFWKMNLQRDESTLVQTESFKNFTRSEMNDKFQEMNNKFHELNRSIYYLFSLILAAQLTTLGILITKYYQSNECDIGHTVAKVLAEIQRQENEPSNKKKRPQWKN